MKKKLRGAKNRRGKGMRENEREDEKSEELK